MVARARAPTFRELTSRANCPARTFLTCRFTSPLANARICLRDESRRITLAPPPSPLRPFHWRMKLGCNKVASISREMRAAFRVGRNWIVMGTSAVPHRNFDCSRNEKRLEAWRCVPRKATSSMYSLVPQMTDFPNKSGQLLLLNYH